jgi:uncharacterized protein YxeA
MAKFIIIIIIIIIVIITALQMVCQHGGSGNAILHNKCTQQQMTDITQDNTTVGSIYCNRTQKCSYNKLDHYTE